MGGFTQRDSLRAWRSSSRPQHRQRWRLGAAPSPSVMTRSAAHSLPLNRSRWRPDLSLGPHSPARPPAPACRHEACARPGPHTAGRMSTACGEAMDGARQVRTALGGGARLAGPQRQPCPSRPGWTLTLAPPCGRTATVTNNHEEARRVSALGRTFWSLQSSHPKPWSLQTPAFLTTSSLNLVTVLMVRSLAFRILEVKRYAVGRV